jgi:hypothetical protein
MSDQNNDEKTSKCFNCGEIEELIEEDGELGSDFEMIQTDLKGYSSEEERYIPLCQDCAKLYQSGKLEGIEERWMAEENRREYIGDISMEEGEECECDGCGKQIPKGMFYYSVDKCKEERDGEMEIENLLNYCQNCFKKIEAVFKKHT